MADQPPQAPAEPVAPLSEIDKMKADFISLVAHELREPLAITRWSVELLTPDELASVPQSVKEKIEDIYQSNKRMIDLVNDLLDVSKIDEGRVPDDPTQTDLVAAINGVITDLSGVAREKNVTISFHVDKTQEWTRMIDQERFKEVIKNLLSNAIKFNKKDGSVIISLVKKDHTYVIEVVDTGIGIPIDEQGKLFEKFSRTSNSIRQQLSGSGLGLYKVKSYVVAWGGNVGVESQEGNGARFWIELPYEKNINS